MRAGAVMVKRRLVRIQVLEHDPLNGVAFLDLKVARIEGLVFDFYRVEWLHLRFRNSNGLCLATLKVDGLRGNTLLIFLEAGSGLLVNLRRE